MPVYEFYCPHCRKDFEELCAYTASENMSCPACGRPAQKRLSVFAGKSSGSFLPSSGGSCSGCSRSSCTGCGH